MVRTFQRDHADVDVLVVPLDHGEEARAVMSGAVDVAVVCLLARPDGPTSTVLWEEPTMVALSVLHELAQRTTLTLGDLAPFERARFDATASDGRTLRDADDRLDFLAGGTTVHFVPALVAQRYRHPEVSFIPVEDAPPTPVVALVDGDREPALVGDFIAAARSARHAGAGGG